MLLGLADSCAESSNFDCAINKYYAALKASEKKSDPVLIARAWVGIGSVRIGQNDVPAAREALANAYSSLGEVELASAYNLDGNIHLSVHQWDSAGVAFEKAMALNTKEGNGSGIAANLHNLSMVAAMQGDADKGMAYLQQMLALCDSIGDMHRKCFALRSIGGAYARAQDYEKSFPYFVRAKELAKEIGALRIESIATENASRVAGLMGDYTAAYNYHLAYKILADSLQNQIYNRSIAELETEYKTVQKEKEIQQLERDKALLDENAHQSLIIYIVSIIALVLIGATAYLLVTRRRTQQRLIMERELVELEQKALRLQMNPHFIFNSLNAIQGFIAQKNEDDAKRYLSRFAKLMRLTLDSSREQHVTLAAEKELLELYLSLTALRYDQKFSFEINVDEQLDQEGNGIPPMLIQPFVENAVVHGVAPSEVKSSVVVNIRKTGEHLYCEVVDTGIGREESRKRKLSSSVEHKSAGVDVTKQRLDMINSKFGVNTNFLITDNEPGTIVSFNLPLINLWN